MIALLFRHRSFRLLWTGETTSEVGSSVTTVVMPLLAATTLRASAFVVSLLSAATWLPWLVVGFPAGAWIDQLRQRRWLMIACDLAAAIAFGSVPLAWALGVLTVAQLLVVALAAGTVAVLFNTSYRAFLIDAVVDDQDRALANSALQGSQSAARVAGPGLGGLLVQTLGAATTLLADSASFLFSAACLLAIRHHPRPHAPIGTIPPLHQRVGDGIRYVRRDPLLRALTLFGGTSNLALCGYQSILVVFLLRDTHLRASAVGVVLALTGLGGISGALIANPLARCLGSARALLVTKLAGGACALLIPLATSPDRAVFAIAGGILVGVGIIAGNIITTTFIQSYVRAEIFARTAATNSVINYGTMPLGALLGGVLASALGLPAAVWITTAMVPFAAVFLLASPLPHLRDLPTRHKPATHCTAT